MWRRDIIAESTMRKLFTCVIAAFCAVAVFAKNEVIITEGNVKFMQEAGKTAIVEINFPDTRVVEFDDEIVKNDFGSLDQYLRTHNDDWTATLMAENAAGMDVDIAAMRKQMMANYNGTWYNMKNKKGMKLLAPESLQNSLATMDAKQIAQLEKYGTVFGDRANADYKFVINIDKIDMGNNGGVALNSMFGSFAKEAGGAIFTGSMEVIDMKTNTLVAKGLLNQVKGGSAATPDSRVHLALTDLFVEELLPLSKKKK